MTIDYFDDLEDFYLNLADTNTATEAQHRIVEILGEFDLEVPETERSEQELQAEPGHVLFGWKYDYDLSLSIFAIPESKLSAELWAAMKKVDFKAYAYHELSLGDDYADAFQRIDVAMGLDEHAKGAAAAIADTDKACLGDYRILYVEDEQEPVIEEGGFDKRFVAAFTVTRAQ